MNQLFLFPAAAQRDPAVDAWLTECPGNLGEIARRWFAVMRDCGDDVRELLHDDQPTACMGEAAFACVDSFSFHANVGFFRGAKLDDPAQLLQGTGKFMRHAKLRPGEDLNASALVQLIEAVYRDMQARVGLPRVSAASCDLGSRFVPQCGVDWTWDAPILGPLRVQPVS